MPNNKVTQKRLDYLVELGLFESKEGGKEREYRVSESGYREYAQHLAGMLAVEDEPGLMDGSKDPRSRENLVYLRKGINKAIELSARVQEAVQKGEIKEDPNVLKAEAAAISVIAKRKGMITMHDMDIVHAYFTMLLQNINPENMEYWLYGKSRASFCG